MRQIYAKKKTNNKGFLLIAVAIIIAFLAFQKFNQGSFFNKAGNQNKDNIIAEMNGENIYQKEVEQKYKTLLSANENVNLSNLSTSVLEILIRDVYIDKKILLETKTSSVINMAEIEEQVSNFKTKLIRSTYLDSLTKNSIDEQKILDKFNEISGQFNAKNEYYFQQIIVANQEEAKKVYQQIFAKKKALKFVDALKKYSKDKANFSASENFIAEDQIKPEIVAVLNVLKEREVSQPFAVGDEWLIIKKISLKLPEKLELEDYKEKIKQVLLKNEVEKVIGNLVKDANIKILIPTKSEEKAVEEKPVEEKVIEEKVEEKTLDEKSTATNPSASESTDSASESTDSASESTDSASESTDEASQNQEQPSQPEKITN